jgi:hypothetical protein
MKDQSRSIAKQNSRVQRLTDTTLATWMLGFVYRLPLNAKLRAHSVYEIPVDPLLIETARALYGRHIAPRLSEQHGSFQSGDLALYVNRPPGWWSDISWWSADDLPTYRYFETEFFRKLSLGERLHRLIDIDRTVRVYSSMFVVRSWCEQTRFHRDYAWGCGPNCYTLMMPLEDMSATEAGHLAYLDVLGRLRIYRYNKGTAVVFGTGFRHGTQCHSGGPPHPFLCFTFGSDKEKYWSELQKSISGQSRLLRRPGGTFMRDMQPLTPSQT